VFTRSVANLRRQEDRHRDPLRAGPDLRRGPLRVRVSVVVGPRFSGAPPTPRAFAANRRQGGAAGDISIEVVADASLTVETSEVPTHEVVSRRPADGTLRLNGRKNRSRTTISCAIRWRASSQRRSPQGGRRGASSRWSCSRRARCRAARRTRAVFVVDVSARVGHTAGDVAAPYAELCRGCGSRHLRHHRSPALPARVRRSAAANAADVRQALASWTSPAMAPVAQCRGDRALQQVAAGRHRSVFPADGT
jgi:hypothetical protein